MTRQNYNLAGKWQIVGAEKFNPSTESWQKSKNYVEGMCWDFTPKVLNNNKIIGVITETSPNGNTEQMSYLYHTDKQLLEIDIFTDSTPSNYTDPQADKYEVIIENEHTIKLSILNEYGCPPAYFRYLLVFNSLCK